MPIWQMVLYVRRVSNRCSKYERARLTRFCLLCRGLGIICCFRAQLPELLKSTNIQPGFLSLSLGTESILERLGLDDMCPLRTRPCKAQFQRYWILTYLAKIGVCSIVKKGHRELIPAEQNGVGVILFRRKTCAEVVQGRLGDNPRVAYKRSSRSAEKHLRCDLPNQRLSGCTRPGVVSSSPFWNAAAWMTLPVRSRMALPPLSIFSRLTFLASR